jgi:hypothetical protein
MLAAHGEAVPFDDRAVGERGGTDGQDPAERTRRGPGHRVAHS